MRILHTIPVRAMAAALGLTLWSAYGDALRKESASGPTSSLYALRIDAGAERVVCRGVPFFAAAPNRRGESRRIVSGTTETLSVGCKADALYLLGMCNQNWDHGLAHWGEHPEFKAERDDQIQIGSNIGSIEIRYADGESDSIPLIMGATAWHVDHWAFGPGNSVMKPVKEPFASRPEYAAALEKSLLLHEDPGVVVKGRSIAAWMHFYLAVHPRLKAIESLVVHDNPKLRGRPLVSGVTLSDPDRTDGLEPLGDVTPDPADLKTRVESSNPRDWSGPLEAFAAALYTSEKDLPDNPEPVELPPGLDAARIRFEGGGRWGAMLTNVWNANLTQISNKFEADTGMFRETGKDTPWYGGYEGIGTWAPDIGVYSHWAYGRCADHLATVGLRALHDEGRRTAFVDFCDKWLYFYRANHDPALGPPNEKLDIDKYPKDAPPHWAFVINGPLDMCPWQINEIHGNEEMDGHGATIVGRWAAWRLVGRPAGDWLRAPRADIYGKSRWDSTRDAAEFICWLMDYTGRDLIYSEGESTQWGGGGENLSRCPANMREAVDEAARKEKYAKADMYEVYPAQACLVALRCSAEIADAAGEKELAKKWRAYAGRIEKAMPPDLTLETGEAAYWKCTLSVFPSGMEALAPAFFAIYRDGYDPRRWNPDFALRTRNTLLQRIDAKPGPGTAAALASGYGQGWLTHTALFVDEMDAAGEALVNITRYAYDKNMNWADEARGLDWRKWLYIIPEGTNILPDGRWHRIGDLSNGANQGPAMHAIEAAAGVDDTDPAHTRIMPRIPDPLTAIEVKNFPVVLSVKDGTAVARLEYRYDRKTGLTLKCDRPIPRLSVRLGPFESEAAAGTAAKGRRLPPAATDRVESSGRYRGGAAWWAWVEDVRDMGQLSLGT